MDSLPPTNIRVQGVDVDADDEMEQQETDSATVDQQLDSLPKVETKNLDSGMDLTALDPETLDDAMDYRFVHNSPAKITKRLRRGWTFVRKSEDHVQKIFEPQQEGTDDFIRDGDTILMKIQKERHKLQVDRVKQVTRARLAAPKGQFRKKAAEKGYNVAGKKYRGEPS